MINSNDLIICSCGCNKKTYKYDATGRIKKFIHGHNRRNKLHSEEIKKKISESEKGKVVSIKTKLKQSKSRLQYFIKNPDKEKERYLKIGDALRGRKQRAEVILSRKEKWKNPLYREMHLKKMLNFKTPNNPERRMIEIINKFNLPYKFVGNGALLIGGFNPDFVNYDKQKILIEIFGDYWHKRPDWERRDKKRLEAFTSAGYKTIIFWEHELVKRKEVKNSPILTEEQITMKIKNLVNK